MFSLLFSRYVEDERIGSVLLRNGDEMDGRLDAVNDCSAGACRADVESTRYG